MTHHQGERQKERRWGGSHVKLVSPSVIVTICLCMRLHVYVCVCAYECFGLYQHLLCVLMCTHGLKLRLLCRVSLCLRI